MRELIGAAGGSALNYMSVKQSMIQRYGADAFATHKAAVQALLSTATKRSTNSFEWTPPKPGWGALQQGVGGNPDTSQRSLQQGSLQQGVGGGGNHRRSSNRSAGGDLRGSFEADNSGTASHDNGHNSHNSRSMLEWRGGAWRVQQVEKKVTPPPSTWSSYAGSGGVGRVGRGPPAVDVIDEPFSSGELTALEIGVEG